MWFRTGLGLGLLRTILITVNISLLWHSPLYRMSGTTHAESTVDGGTAGGRLPAVSLAALRKGARGVVSGIVDDGQGLGDASQSTVARRLLELGFCPGEHVEVIEQIWPGGDPLAVRVGNSVFALRRREAALVLVVVEAAAA
jgi:ferrous iron transport protein A